MRLAGVVLALLAVVGASGVVCSGGSSESKTHIATSATSQADRPNNLRPLAVPPAVARRIASTLKTPIVLPVKQPTGLVYSKWRYYAKAVGGTGRVVYVTFDHGGAAWDINVGKSVDMTVECPKNGRPTIDVNHRASINGRTVFYSNGIQGDRAWTCFPAKSIGNSQPIDVGLWLSHVGDNPITTTRAMRIVATARVVQKSGY